jgi:hypothetical protein
MDKIKIRIGADPWLPSSTSHQIAELNRYDIPTEGIIKQDGQLFLYRCLDGHQSEESLWLYVPLTRKEARRLRQAVGGEVHDLQHRIVEQAAREARPLVAAMAHFKDGLFAETQVHVLFEETEAAAEVLESQIAEAGVAEIRERLRDRAAGMDWLLRPC